MSDVPRPSARHYDEHWNWHDHAVWGTVVSVFAADAASGNNIVFCTNLSLIKTINSGDTVTFPAGTLTLTIQ
jgi:hypothetical protein